MASWSTTASFSFLFLSCFICLRYVAEGLAAVSQQFFPRKKSSFSPGLNDSGRGSGYGSGKSVLSMNASQGQNFEELLLVVGLAVTLLVQGGLAVSTLGEKCGHQEPSLDVKEPSPFLRLVFFRLPFPSWKSL